jgi:hypothetical protein
MKTPIVADRRVIGKVDFSPVRLAAAFFRRTLGYV